MAHQRGDGHRGLRSLEQTSAKMGGGHMNEVAMTGAGPLENGMRKSYSREYPQAKRGMGDVANPCSERRVEWLGAMAGMGRLA